MLSVESLTASYGPVPVISGVSFSLGRSEVVALLGRNGVGKTTLLRTLMNRIPGSAGHVVLDGAHLSGKDTFEIARHGMALVPQGRGIIGKLSVEENLRVGTRAAGERGALSIAQALAPFPALMSRLSDRAGSLSGGQQQQLALARAMISRPKVMLLDEPSEGVQPNIVAEIGQLIRRVSVESGVSVLLVEQNIELALSAADRCLVMEKGRIVHGGPAAEFRNEDILKQYLAL